MNWYNLSRDWFEFLYSNNDKCKHIHTVLYFYILDLWNKLWQKEKFWLPTQMTMEMLGIWSYNTYKKAYDDLVKRWFIKEVNKSTNQYSSRIIAMSKYDKALDEATDKSLYKATYEATDKPTDKPTDIIDKQINKETNKQINNNTDKDFDLFFSHYPIKKWKPDAKKAFVKAIKKTTIDVMIKSIQNQKLEKEEKQKKGEFTPNRPRPQKRLNKEYWNNDCDEIDWISKYHTHKKKIDWLYQEWIFDSDEIKERNDHFSTIFSEENNDLRKKVKKQMLMWQDIVLDDEEKKTFISFIKRYYDK